MKDENSVKPLQAWGGVLKARLNQRNNVLINPACTAMRVCLVCSVFGG
jgi:hypothetical protein